MLRGEHQVGLTLQRMQRGPVMLVRRNEVKRAVFGFFGDWVELFGAIVRVLRLE